MTPPRIGIILGSIREGRIGESVAQWVLEQAKQRDDATFELVDLAEYAVPLLTSATVPGAANKQYDDPNVTQWGATIDELDGYIFVTAEYNHSVPGAFKNAFDSLGSEWSNKALGLVSYGADGGVRAVEHWRVIAANLHLHAVRGQVSLSLFTDFGENGVAPMDRRAGELSTLLDQVVALTSKLRG